jgi:hypothetical protein
MHVADGITFNTFFVFYSGGIGRGAELHSFFFSPPFFSDDKVVGENKKIIAVTCIIAGGGKN